MDQTKTTSNDAGPDDIASLVPESLRDLSDAERELLTTCRSGSGYSAKPDDSKPDSAIVRASFLRWLCEARTMAPLLHAKGIRLTGAHIEGRLDLEAVSCDVPLLLQDCDIPDGLALNGAKFRFLSLAKSTVGGISARGLILKGSLIIEDARISGAVELQTSEIGGTLSARGARLEHPSGIALNLEAASFGAVMLPKGFRCHGAIRAYATTVDRTFECYGTIVAPNMPVALAIEGCRIGGAVLLRDTFRCLGRVRVFAGTIEGSLDFQSARLVAKGIALYVDGTKIGADFLLRTFGQQSSQGPTLIVGGVNCRRLSLAGHLDLTGVHIRARKNAALNLADAAIHGRIIANHCEIDGETILARASSGSDVSFVGARLQNGRGPALRAPGLHCNGTLDLSELSAVGSIVLRGATITDMLRAVGLRVRAAVGALNIEFVRIGSDTLFRDARIAGGIVAANAELAGRLDFTQARIRGRVVLDLARIGSHVSFQSAVLHNPNGAALSAASVSIKGSLFLARSRFRGSIDAPRLSIEGDILGEKAKIVSQRYSGMALPEARIQGSLSLAKSVIGGGLTLSGATIERDLRLRGTYLKRPGSIAIDGTALKVGGDVRIDDGATVDGGLLLSRSRIGGDLSVAGISTPGARFADLDCSGSHIGGDLQLSGFWMSTDRPAGGVAVANLNRLTVGGDARLRDASFEGPAPWRISADNMTVRGTLDLSGTIFAGELDLHNAKVGGLADTEQRWSHYAAFNLDGLTYSSLAPDDVRTRLRWLRQSSKSGPAIPGQSYDQLSQLFRSQGRESDARQVAIAKQWLITKRVPLLPWRWLRKLWGWSIAFGYRPHRVAFVAPIFIALLALLLSGGETAPIQPTKDEALAKWSLHQPRPVGYPKFEPWAYSIDAFIPFLKLGQVDHWQPDENARCSGLIERCGDWLHRYLWVHIALGALITALTAAGLAGLVRKD